MANSVSFDTHYDIDFGNLRIHASHIRFYTENDNDFITYTDLMGQRYVKPKESVTRVTLKACQGVDNYMVWRVIYDAEKDGFNFFVK